MADNSDLKPPKRGITDIVWAGGKFVAAFPLSPFSFLGAATLQLIEDAFGAPESRKRDEWCKNVAAAISTLQQEVSGLRAEIVQNDRRFKDILEMASNVAARFEPNEPYPMYRALQSAIVSAVTEETPRRDMVNRIVRALQMLMPTHLIIFKYFSELSWINEFRERFEQSWSRDPKNKYIPDDLKERTFRTWSRLSYGGAFLGITLAGLKKEESKVFIDDLHREGLLLSPDEYKRLLPQDWNVMPCISPLTHFGHQIHEFLHQFQDRGLVNE